MPKRKKQTPLVKEYQKERKRIKKFLDRARKAGYIWEESPLPDVPKQIRKASVNRLKKLTPDELYKRIYYIVPETGELVSGTRGRSLRRSESSKKAYQTQLIKKGLAEQQLQEDQRAEELELVINNLIEFIKSLQVTWEVHETNREKLIQLIELLLRSNKKALAERIKKNAQRLSELIEGSIFASGNDDFEINVSEIVALIGG